MDSKSIQKQYSSIRTRSSIFFTKPNLEYPRWSCRNGHLIALIALGMNIHNFYFFPYYALNFGGLPFFIAYVVMMIVIGYPMTFLEMAMGQFFHQGPIRCFDFIPIARGLGYASSIVNFVCILYYPVFAVYSLIYISELNRDPIPWRDCDSNINCSPRLCCGAKKYTNSTVSGEAVGKMDPMEHFFFSHILRTDFDNNSRMLMFYGLGSLQYRKVACNLVFCIVTYILSLLELKRLEVVFKISVIFPYFCLLSGLMIVLRLGGLPGALAMLFGQNIAGLGNIQMWGVATMQVMRELSLGQGLHMTFGYYVHHRSSIAKDALILCVVNFVTSLLSALIVFGIIFVIGLETETMPNTTPVSGGGLVMYAFPEIFTRDPSMSRTMCFIFFLMLFMIILSAQVIHLLILVSSFIFEEEWMEQFKWLINLIASAIFFLFSMYFWSANGFFFMHVLNDIAAGLTRYPIVLGTSLMMAWTYGLELFNNDLTFLSGKNYIVPIIQVMWLIIPFLIVLPFAGSIIYSMECRFGIYYYATTSKNLGWIIFIFGVIVIFGFMFWWFANCVLRKAWRFILRPAHRIPRKFYKKKIIQHAS